MKLSIANFRSFMGNEVFEFPDGPGLYFMRGENREEERLEANGSGKSTTWDALTWLLYNKTSRGLRGGDVCNWRVDKGTRVTFQNGKDIVTRTWGPIKFAHNGYDADADLGKQLTGLEYKPWLHCVLMAQAQPMFLDLKGDAKAALFSEVLGLDAWLQRAQRASEVASEADKVVRAAERDLAALQGRLSSMESQDVAVQEAEWERARNERADACVLAFDSCRDLRKAKQAKHQDIKQGFLEKIRALDKAEKDKSDHEVAADAAWAEVQRLTSETRITVHRASQTEQMRDHADRDHCPYCEQDIPHKHRDRVVKDLERQADALLADAEEFEAEAERHRNNYNTLRKDIEALGTTVQQLQKDADRAELDMRTLVREIEDLDKRMDKLELDVQSIEAERNPFAAMQARISADRARCKAEVTDVQAKLQREEERRDLAALWARGFKEVRLHAIGDALEQLEIEVNSGLTALGLLGWEMRFDVDKETRSGTIQKGFAVTVTSPGSSRPVAWEAWSGGEAQRLRLAANMGLAALIRAHTQVTLDLEVWDEPTAFLSAQGVQDVLDALRTRADQESRQIWVVDHRSLSYGAFDGTVTVVKDSNGSRFVWG